MLEMGGPIDISDHFETNFHKVKLTVPILQQ